MDNESTNPGANHTRGFDFSSGDPLPTSMDRTATIDFTNVIKPSNKAMWKPEYDNALLLVGLGHRTGRTEYLALAQKLEVPEGMVQSRLGALLEQQKKLLQELGIKEYAIERRFQKKGRNVPTLSGIIPSAVPVTEESTDQILAGFGSLGLGKDTDWENRLRSLKPAGKGQSANQGKESKAMWQEYQRITREKRNQERLERRETQRQNRAERLAQRSQQKNAEKVQSGGPSEGPSNQMSKKQRKLAKKQARMRGKGKGGLDAKKDWLQRDAENMEQ